MSDNRMPTEAEGEAIWSWIDDEHQNDIRDIVSLGDDPEKAAEFLRTRLQIAAVAGFAIARNQPTAKPLEWRDKGTWSWAETPFGVYYDIKECEGCAVWNARFEADSDWKKCDSIEHGKQLAEADWQRRIKEILQ